MAKKKIKKAILAGLAAYAAAKTMGKKGPVEGLSTDKFDMKAKNVYAHELSEYKKRVPPKGHPGGWNWESKTFSSPPTPKKWYEFWKKHGGSVKTEHARFG